MQDNKYVSRGGTKLEYAIKIFKLNISGLTVLDVGSSTGGFVDYLLQHDAMKVYSVDTAYGELAWKLRIDPRVVVMERENILFLKLLPEQVDLVTIDVTFTSLTKMLPAIKKCLKQKRVIIALLKPQYEDQKLSLKHHGIIPESFHQEIIRRVKETAENVGYKYIDLITSPILGREGNKEYFIILSEQDESKDLIPKIPRLRSGLT